MRKTELLAPAGSFEVGLCALYGHADAIYLALDSFGARAYAKNFSKDELKEILKIAHSLNKKVYVTVNTVIKNSELESVYSFLDAMYEYGVDAIICADIAVFMYVIENLPGMGVHISTQVGVKDLNDTLFFEEIGAERVVLAREDSIEEIKKIKENSNIELEVFIHGALCVSYSGGCLFSSMLSLRSGNRGRCSQNCRREYVITEDGKPITKPGFYLSMKDLYVNEEVKQLVKLKIDSLKIEGRMKNSSYVDTILNHYNGIINNLYIDKNKINQIFHRQFTKGFIFNEDRKNIATITDSSSQGSKIGQVISKKGNKLYIKTNEILRKNERIRFLNNDDSQYFTVDKLYDEDGRISDNLVGNYYLECSLNIEPNSVIYKMKDNEMMEVDLNTNLIPLEIFVTGKKEHPLNVVVKIKDDYISIDSKVLLSKAINNPVNKDMIYRQLNKLNDTPFFIETISYDIEDDLFMSVSQINELRRTLVEEIYNLFKIQRNIPTRKELKLNKVYSLEEDLIAYVKTKEQYDACKSMGLKTIFFENYVPYVGAKYNKIENDEVLVANYGGLREYKDKIITTDHHFNVMNKDSILHLLNFGASNVTLSYENSFNEIKEIAEKFYIQHQQKAPLDFVIYGKQKLMTMKYCPLKKLGLCGECRKKKYHLVDKFGKFLISTREDCIVEIYNNQILNLTEYIQQLKPYINRFRLDFIDETYTEVVEVIDSIKKNKNTFDGSKHTRGYFKRNIM